MQIVYNPDTGKSKGFGFISFEDPRDAQDAIVEADGKVNFLLLQSMCSSACCSFGCLGLCFHSETLPV